MDQKQKLQLNALDLSDRLSGYRKRSMNRVEPRSHVNHLQKRVGMDVWEPLTKPQQPLPLTKKAIAKQKIMAPKVVKHSKINQYSLPAQTAHLTTNKATASPMHANNNQLAGVSDFTKSAQEWKQTKKTRDAFGKKKLANYALYAMAVFVFLFGIVAGIRSLLLDNQIAKTVSAQANNQSAETTTTDETKPSDDEVRSYNVAPELPKTIYITKLNIHARVRQMSTDNKDALEAPKNIHDVGWYKDSAKPGSPGGASIIDGHVSGPTQKGVFYRIETLQNGDIITIERGDGRKIDYKVKKVEIKKATELDMNQMLLPVTSGKHGLNLITCTGKFDSKTKTYEDRALVYAEVVQSN